MSLPNDAATEKLVSEYHRRRAEDLARYLEWALNRLDHVLFLETNKDSVEAGLFGIEETVASLKVGIPKARRLLKR